MTDRTPTEMEEPRPPRTEAGRALFGRLWAVNEYSQASRIIATVEQDIVRIEDEAALLSGGLSEARLREALDRLVKAWDAGTNSDPGMWKSLDREIDAALVQARSALAQALTGETPR